jgi:uncharacterized surface protein with fasciclin (FAS1) repeats
MNRSRALKSFALVAVLALPLAACSDDEDDAADTTTTEAPAETSMAPDTEAPDMTEAPAELGTIVETAVAAGDFETLVAAVTAAELAETLSGGEYTVFAPTDEAFQPLVDDGTVDTLLEDPSGALTDILLNHVVEGTVMAEDVVALGDGAEVTTVGGGTLTVNIADDGTVSLTDGAGNTINITTTDIETSNGVIHVIDGVLLPAEG